MRSRLPLTRAHRSCCRKVLRSAAPTASGRGPGRSLQQLRRKPRPRLRHRRRPQESRRPPEPLPHPRRTIAIHCRTITIRMYPESVGHGFSRAVMAHKMCRALAPEGPHSPSRLPRSLLLLSRGWGILWKHLERHFLRVRRNFLVRVARSLGQRSLEHEISFIPRILPLAALDRSLKVKCHPAHNFRREAQLIAFDLGALEKLVQELSLVAVPSTNRETNPVTWPVSSTVNCTNSPSFRNPYIPEYAGPPFASGCGAAGGCAPTSPEGFASCARSSGETLRTPNPSANANPQMKWLAFMTPPLAAIVLRTEGSRRPGGRPVPHMRRANSHESEPAPKQKGSSPRLKPFHLWAKHPYFFVAFASMNGIQFVPSVDTSNFRL